MTNRIVCHRLSSRSFDTQDVCENPTAVLTVLSPSDLGVLLQGLTCWERQWQPWRPLPLSSTTLMPTTPTLWKHMPEICMCESRACLANHDHMAAHHDLMSAHHNNMAAHHVCMIAHYTHADYSQ